MIRGIAVFCVLVALVSFKKLLGIPSSGGTPQTDKSANASFGIGSGSGSSGHSSTTPASAATALEWQAPMHNYPRPDTFNYQGNSLIADYAPDSLLNSRIKLYLQRYRPEIGVILLADLGTGHVVAMGEREDSLIAATPRLAYGGGYPAASLVKILTATAALESNAKELTDSIPQLGGYHTLYRRQLKTIGQGRFPKITLEEAFSKSVNPAFGMLGMSMGAQALLLTASRMGFNQPILPSSVARSRIEFPDSGFSLAEASCGFTAKTTISPWHALQIARGAGDDGRLRACSFANSITNADTHIQIPIKTDTGCAFVSAENLPMLQGFMEATVRKGTSRKGFHANLKANHMAKIIAGGKTGSLDGEVIKGRFDWFVGYVKLKDDPSKGLAISIMLVHREYAGIHASAMAALLIRDWLIAHEKALKARAAKQREAELSNRAV